MATDNYRPRWRSDATGAGGLATESDWRGSIDAAKEVLLSWQEHDQSTLGDLVEGIGAFTNDEQSAVWAQIEAWAESEADDKAKAELRERIRRFASGDRARFLYDKLRPEDLVVRHEWLFAKGWVEWSRDELTAKDDDFEARDARIDDLRQSAMKEIWAAHGLEGVMAMVENGGDGHTVGRYAASCATNAEEVLRECLFRDAAIPEFDGFMGAYIAACVNRAESELLLDVSRQLEPGQSVRLWCCAPFHAKTWRMLDRLANEEVRAEYWRKVSPFFHRRFTEAECTEIVEELLGAGRPRTAFGMLAGQWKQIETASLKRLLMNLVSAGDDETYPIAPHDVADALRVLDGRSTVPSSEMARLEFAFSPALDERGMPNLVRQVAESPAFFVELLAHAFVRRDGGEDPPAWHVDDESRRRALARAARGLLQKASRIPGTEADGSINADALLRWISETRQLCAAFGREAVGDRRIGELLSKAPPDDDGAWPCDAVCQALEAAASQDVAQGFAIGKRNARGVLFRSGEGGDEERELAAQYRSWAHRRRFDYPFAGSAINRIAESYESDAKHEDARATLAKRLNTRG